MLDFLRILLHDCLKALYTKKKKDAQKATRSRLSPCIPLKSRKNKNQVKIKIKINDTNVLK